MRAVATTAVWNREGHWSPGGDDLDVGCRRSWQDKGCQFIDPWNVVVDGIPVTGMMGLLSRKALTVVETIDAMMGARE